MDGPSLSPTVIQPVDETVGRASLLPDVDSVTALYHVDKLRFIPRARLQLVADWLISFPPGTLSHVLHDNSVLVRRRHLPANHRFYCPEVCESPDLLLHGFVLEHILEQLQRFYSVYQCQRGCFPFKQ